MVPLVFDPYLRPQIWGGRKLQKLGKVLPPEGRFGESWEISTQTHHVSRVAEGPLKGTLLTDLCQQHAAELFGPAAKYSGDPVHGEKPPGAGFPLLIKLLDCQELLSVQVHPSDTMAQQLLGEENGKTEAWIILETGPEGRIYAGLKPGTTRAVLERHLQDKCVERCLHSFVPQVGDCVFLPAGTVHAVGGGVLMAEVQQTSDATFRLYDWNRLGSDGKPRQLHLADALASINWDAGPVQPIRVGSAPINRGKPNETGDCNRQRLVDCRYFEMDRFPLADKCNIPAGQLSVWMVLEGQAVLESNEPSYRRLCHRGETVLVPASAVGLSWNPVSAEEKTTLLGVHLP